MTDRDGDDDPLCERCGDGTPDPTRCRTCDLDPLCPNCYGAHACAPVRV